AIERLSGRAAHPGHRTAAAIPVRASNHVVAIAIAGVAADEAIGIRDAATGPRAAVAPGHRPTIAVPVRALNQVVAVAQRDDDGVAAIVTDLILGIAADKAIGVGDDAADPCIAAAPGYRPTLAVPIRTNDHIVAVAQRGDA